MAFQIKDWLEQETTATGRTRGGWGLTIEVTTDNGDTIQIGPDDYVCVTDSGMIFTEKTSVFEFAYEPDFPDPLTLQELCTLEMLTENMILTMQNAGHSDAEVEGCEFWALRNKLRQMIAATPE